MVTWTEEDLRNYERKRKSFTATHIALAPKPSYPLSQQAGGGESIQSHEVKEGSQRRITVRITRLGTRWLDADNLAGGCKLVVDELRYSGLIPNDNPESITLEIRQAKVKKEFCCTP